VVWREALPQSSRCGFGGCVEGGRAGEACQSWHSFCRLKLGVVDLRLLGPKGPLPRPPRAIMGYLIKITIKGDVGNVFSY
jgi:hypothetical protein